MSHCEELCLDSQGRLQASFCRRGMPTLPSVRRCGWCRVALQKACWCQIGLYIKDKNSGVPRRSGCKAPLPRSWMSRVPARPEVRVSCPSQLHEVFSSARHPDPKAGNAKPHSILKKWATFGVCGGRMRCCLEVARAPVNGRSIYVVR